MKVTDDWGEAFITLVGDLSGTSKSIGRECGFTTHGRRGTGVFSYFIF